ncbi:SH3 domain-containing protein [Lachnospiraceae bacterium OttesenSCG-928-D06]|nr:SH3 domain-containing protein [Lachnospiraceae bacterium OttesenSCG-928-D06]
MKEQDEDLKFLDEGDKNPKFIIISLVVVAVVLIGLGIMIWWLTHRNVDIETKAEEVGMGYEEITNSQNVINEGSSDNNEDAQNEIEQNEIEQNKESSYGNESLTTSEALVEMEFQELSDTVTAKDVTNLRSEPSTSSNQSVVTQLKNGVAVKRTGINSDTGWSRLEYDNMVVYAVTQYLTTDLTKKEEDAPVNNSSGQSANNTTNQGNNTTSQDNNTTNQGNNGTNQSNDTTGQGNNGTNQGNNTTSQENSATGQENNTTKPENSTANESGTASTNGDTVTTYDGRTMTFTPCDDIVSPKMEVNLRGEPSTSQGNDTIHYRLPYNENVHRTGINEDTGWSRVEYNGEVLYAVTNYLFVVE